MRARLTRTLSHPFGLGATLVAAILAGTAAWTAAEVRDCPRSGHCEWSPWLRILAGLVSLLAVVACIRLAIWSRHGRGGFQAVLMLAAAAGSAIVWIAAFWYALVSSAG